MIKAFKAQHWDLLEEKLKKVVPLVKFYASQDGVVRFLLTLIDGNQLETVLLPFHRKNTVCLSSQVGCQNSCQFCSTASLKSFRNISEDEILAQYFGATLYLKRKDPLAPLPNIVVMGQGEPLQNFEALKGALGQLLIPSGLYLGPRQITVSTVGHLPGLKRFLELGGVNLAISLHAANNDLRSQLIPLNRSYPLELLKEELCRYCQGLKKRQYIAIEYLLLEGINDDCKAADQLASFCQSLPVIVNLIAFNEYPQALFRRPCRQKVEHFKEMLVEKHLRVMVRATKGDQVLAACGQLASQDFFLS